MAYGYDPEKYETENNDLPKQIEGVGITEQLGKNLKNLPIELTDQNGSKKKFADYLPHHRPVLLSLVYFNCPSLCNLHLNAVLDALKQLSLVPGRDYDLLAVSFDPKEDSDLAAAKMQTIQEKYQFPKNGEGIHLLTGDENSVKTLADSVGFKYKWDDKQKEWAHASAAILLTPDGVVSRYLHGIYFEPKTFRLSIVEASQGKVGDIVDAVLLFCFHYDPISKTYKVPWYSFKAMQVGCGLTVIAVMFWLLLAWRRQRQVE